MKKIFTLIFFQFKNDIREFDSYFWSFAFPLILFIILVSIFGNISNTESIDLESFKVGMVYESELTGFSKMIIEKTFENAPFQKETFKDLDNAIEKMKNKKLQAVLFFPKDFSTKLNTSLIGLKKISADVNLYYVEGRNDSSITGEILKTFLDYTNIEILKRVKRVEEINVNKVSVTSSRNEFSYKDFIFPGILILSIMSVGFFNIPYNIIFSRQKGINKRFLVAPVYGFSYFISVITSGFLIVLISSILVAIEGIILNISHKFFSIEFLFIYFYSIITIFSFALIFVVLSKSLSTVMTIINIIFQITMFLGGLYFPIFNVPWAVKWIVYINPISYLVEGMRRIVGFNIAPFSDIWIYVVPLIWAMFSLIIFSVNYKRVMGYE